MVDADTVFEPDALYRLIRPLAHPAVGAVSGNTKVGNRRGLLGRWQHLEYVFGFNLDRRMFEVLECMPTVVYEESAIAWTEVPTSLRQLWRQRYRWCYGTLQAMWKHRSAVREVGTAGRSARRGLTYLMLFQVLLPLMAPVVDLFALYGTFFTDPGQALGAWLAFLVLQLLCAGYAVRLDRERLRALWSMPFQLFVYRQLTYLVVIQSVFALLGGTRLKWHRMQRAGTAATEQLRQPVAAPELSSR